MVFFMFIHLVLVMLLGSVCLHFASNVKFYSQYLSFFSPVPSNTSMHLCYMYMRSLDFVPQVKKMLYCYHPLPLFSELHGQKNGKRCGGDCWGRGRITGDSRILGESVLITTMKMVPGVN